MVLKRKRSDCELSSPPTSLSRYAPPAHLGGRTMKRFRDGRPAEEDIHRNTISILFSAQRQPRQQPFSFSSSSPAQATTPEPFVASSPSPSPLSTSSTSSRPAQPAQSSLHRFFSSSRRQPGSLCAVMAMGEDIPMEPETGRLVCDDCGAGAGVDAASMDVDGEEGCGGQVQSCGACARAVCFHCSVSNLGEEVRCLRCANRGAGELGWGVGGL